MMKFLEQLPHFLFFTGKGGVGKTSLACATAVQLADSGKRVLLVSTDPASNVGQVFGMTIGNKITPFDSVPRLSGLEIDPQAAAQLYRDKIVGPVRGVLPESVVKGIEEQLSGACTTEIAAFDEFTALLTDEVVQRDFDHVIFDTAPTGHTLLLLDATGAYHRETARQMGPSGISFTTPMMQLQDSKKTKILIVTLAENTPVLEAAGLQSDLRRADIEPWAWIINNSLAIANPTSPLMRQRASNELAQIDAVTKQYAKRWAVVPLQAQEPIGVERLKKLARHFAS
jgi:arsenite-transporting ATPase